MSSSSYDVATTKTVEAPADHHTPAAKDLDETVYDHEHNKPEASLTEPIPTVAETYSPKKIGRGAAQGYFENDNHDDQDHRLAQKGKASCPRPRKPTE